MTMCNKINYKSGVLSDDNLSLASTCSEFTKQQTLTGNSKSELFTDRMSAQEWINFAVLIQY
jgi:hypothetical protein